MRKAPMLDMIRELIKSKQYIQALNSIEECLESCEENTKELINLKSTLLFEEGKYEEVIDLFKDSIIYEMISEDDAEVFENTSKAYHKLNKKLYSKAILFQAKMIQLTEEEVSKYIEAVNKETKKIEQKVLKRKNEYKLYYTLAYNHVLQLQLVEACIYYKLYQKYTLKDDVVEDEVYDFIMKYQYVSRFYTQLKEEGQTYCIIIPDDNIDTINHYKSIAHALTQLSNKVYVIMPAIKRNTKEESIDKESLINESFEGISVENEISYFYPIELFNKEKSIYSNLEELIIYINNQYCKEDSWIVLGDRNKSKQLISNVELYKITQKAYIDNAPRKWPCMSVMYMGNYLYTAKRMYEFDVPGWMEKKPEVKISIVIPTKDCCYALKDALKTCLDQRYEDYEIVISDNSSIDNMETYNLVQEINSTKIKYYRTPYALPLTKNFEYAYFRTRGEFIFSIGSDDAIFPYTLQYISQVLDNFPDEKILTWQRIGYIWPEYKSTGYADYFEFPLLEQKQPITVNYVDSYEHMKNTINYLNNKAGVVYEAMPSIYINAGMKREQMFEIIKSTGKLLDGCSQDIYTEIVNFALCDRILYLAYPLAVAGMCNRSIGLATLERRTGIENYKELIREYNSTIEFIDSPGTPSQKMLYHQYDYLLVGYELLKVADLNISPKCQLWREQLNLKNLLEWGVSRYAMQGSIYLDFFEIGKKCAYAQGEEIGKWFEQIVNMYNNMPSMKNTAVNFDKRYPKGIAKNPTLNMNTVTIDASDFGISNVYDAVQFLVKLLNV